MKKIDNLKFGQEITLTFRGKSLSEDEGSGTKGDYGLLMEHYVMVYLLEKLSKRGFKVLTDPNDLKSNINEKEQIVYNKENNPQKFKQEIELQKEKADKLSDKLLEDFVDSDDSIFLEFDVKHQEDKTGAPGSADIRLVVKKQPKDVILKEIVSQIRISLKSYKAPSSSQGSKAIFTRFASLFPKKPIGNLNDAGWNAFIEDAPNDSLKEDLKEIRDYIKIAKIGGKANRKEYKIFTDFLESDLFKEYQPNDEEESKRLKKLAKKERIRSGRPRTNDSRYALWNSYLSILHGEDFRLYFSRKITKIFNEYFQERIKTDPELLSRVKEEVKFLAGVDGLAVYNAIGDSKGIKIKNYNVSPGFIKFNEAVTNATSVQFREDGPYVAIDIYLDKSVIFSYKAYVMYAEGAVQVKIHQDALAKGRLN